ncbi:MAG TPA: TolC family protein [Planctomicrobium sp.]|nr:TolC family protein [Planctomicrobium sp.]
MAFSLTSLLANSSTRHFMGWLTLGGVLAFSSTGCSRTFWRGQADRDSYQAIVEKLDDPRWAVPRIDVTPDPNSRFYSPYDPDAEPLPPDDGAAGVFMRWVDGWQGYKGWHKFGETLTVENPQWLANFGWSTDNIDPLTGEIVPPLPEIQNLTLPQAIELAQLNNRDYQFEIENVYLAALAVTFQRFQFDVRYLGRNGVEPQADLNATGYPGLPGDNVALGMAGGVSQLLPAGTQWAVEFANNTLWLFSGGNQTQTVSNLSFSLVQPLLFGAGRKVGLEGLTQTERNLLYEARSLARFRQEIFSQIVGGAPGYLTLLQQIQSIRNLQGNIAQFEEQVERMVAQASMGRRYNNEELAAWPGGPFLKENLPEEIRGKLTYYPVTHQLRWNSNEDITEREIELLQGISDDPLFQASIKTLIASLQANTTTLDVLNLQSSLASNIINLRSQELQLQDNLDRFKMLLGIQTDTKLTLNDAMLEQFEIIDPDVLQLERETKQFVLQSGALDEENLQNEDVRHLYAELLRLIDRVELNGMKVVLNDVERVKQVLPRRRQELDAAEAAMLENDIERVRFSVQLAEIALQQIRGDVFEAANTLQKADLDANELKLVYEAITELRERLLKITQNLIVIQVSVRVELIELQPFELAMQDAVALSLDNRVDLMNVRAQVMDARRKVEIAANALLANLSIVMEGDVSTPVGNKPFDFRGKQSRLRAGLAFTAPLDQIAERNVYRAAQIEYQRAKRAYIEEEDTVKRQVRDAWRQLFVLRQNMETSRRAVRLAALQYDSAVEQSNAPVSGTGSRGSGLSGTNLQRALSTLLSAQNQLIQVWTNYERNRLNIYRDMGIMEIGEDGMWDDPFYRSLINVEADNQANPIWEDNANRSPEHLGAAGNHSDRDRGSRLGTRVTPAGMVALPDAGRVRHANSEKPHSGNHPARPVSHQPERAGISRQP